MVLFWIGVAAAVILVVIALWFLFIYNSLIVLRNRIDNAWSQIDVQLRKRYDLVPNLVETVKGYAKHEKTIFENVTKARTAALGAKGIEEKAQAENILTGALKTLFAVAENYPNLRASENFKLLQEQLDGIESKVAYARQFYNDSVLEYNNSIEVFPNSVVAGMIRYVEQPYFQMEEAARAPVKVQF